MQFMEGASAARAASAERFDLVLVGGGLQNGLIALAALDRRPDRRIALVEQSERPGGNHTWCVHAGDVPESARRFFDPLIVQRWPAYEVRFPAGSRRVRGAYAAVTSERFAERVLGVLARSPGCKTWLGRRAEYVGSQTVVLDDGRVLSAKLVIDARGPQLDVVSSACGFQKFFGVELEFEAPTDVRVPLLMDATVDQDGGYRFFYVLPFSPTRLLVEDTRFALDPRLSIDAARAAVIEYAARFGRPLRVLREERGVLPMPWKSEFEPPRGSPLMAGYRGGWFHPATGYSMPAAIRLAEHIATRAPEAVFDDDFAALYRAHVAQARYGQRLNRMLFHGFAARDMWHAFERFYRLPDAVIHRFYAMALTRGDRARILFGWPPKGLRLGAAFSGLWRRAAAMSGDA
jgi:lycopene beta-cyclase